MSEQTELEKNSADETALNSAGVEDEPVAAAGPGLAEVTRELAGLRRAVGELTAAVRDLAARGVAQIPAAPAAAPAADRMTEEQARAEIREYFLTHRDETIYPEQIAKALNLRLLQVMDICESLAGDGLLNRQA